MGNEHKPSWRDAPLETILRDTLPLEVFEPDERRGEVTPELVRWRIEYHNREWAECLDDELIELCLGSDEWQEVGKAAKNVRNDNRMTDMLLNSDLNDLSTDEAKELKDEMYKYALRLTIPIDRMNDLYHAGLAERNSVIRTIQTHFVNGERTVEDDLVQQLLVECLTGLRTDYETARADTSANEWKRKWNTQQAYSAYQETFIETSQFFVDPRYGKPKPDFLGFAAFVRNNGIVVPNMQPLYHENEQYHLFRALLATNRRKALAIWSQLEFDPPTKGSALSQTPGYNPSFKDVTFLALALHRRDEQGRSIDPSIYEYRLVRETQAEWKKSGAARGILLAGVLGVGFDLFTEKSHGDRFTGSKEELTALYQRIIDHFDQHGKQGFERMAATIIDRFAVPCAMRDELLCYSWAIWSHYHPQAAQSTSDSLLPRLYGADWHSVGRGTFSPVFPDKWGKPWHTPSVDDPTYQKRLKGRGIYTRDYDQVSRRRYPFIDSQEFPWSYSEGISHGQGCSFAEQFLAYRLWFIDQQISQAPLDEAVALIDSQTRGIHSAARDTYIEFALREAVLNKTLVTTEDVEQAYAYFHLMVPDSQRRSALRPLLLRRLIDVGEGTFFSDFETALSTMLVYLPEASFQRNKFLHELELSTRLTPKQVSKVKGLYMDETAVAEQGTKLAGLEVTFFEVITAMDLLSKEDLLCWLLDESQPKPQAIRAIEEAYSGQVDDIRNYFINSSLVEKIAFMERIIVGPEGVLDPDTTGADPEAYARRLAELLINHTNGENHNEARIEVYKDLFVTGLLSVDRLTAAEGLGRLIDRKLEIGQKSIIVSPEEVLYICTSSFFGSYGIKAVQLIADYPWVDPELRAVFQQGMWDVSKVAPSEIMDIWELEKRSRPIDSGYDGVPSLEGFEIVDFIKPLGDASTRQTYLVAVRFPDGEIKTVALRCIRPTLTNARKVKADLGNIELFIDNLRKKGYVLDIPKSYMGILTTAIAEELDPMQVEFQSVYRQKVNGSQSAFYVPQIYAHGHYIILEEYLEGTVLASTDITEGERHQVLARAAMDLLDSNPTSGRIMNIDPHPGNLIRLSNPMLGSIDFGFRLDLRNEPALHQGVIKTFYGIIIGNAQIYSSGLEELGIEGIEVDYGGISLEGRIEQFRTVAVNANSGSQAILLNKLLWWMYRLQAHYLALPEETRQMVPSLLAGGYGGLAN